MACCGSSGKKQCSVLYANAIRALPVLFLGAAAALCVTAIVFVVKLIF